MLLTHVSVSLSLIKTSFIVYVNLVQFIVSLYLIYDMLLIHIIYGD